MKLADQINGYGQTGFYHDNIRLDKINSFKVQHMYFRTKAPPHYQMKFNFSEEDLMEQVCQMKPIYKLDVVFRAGDYRITLDDKEMARASAAREEALVLRERLRELNQGRRSASWEELMNAMLHYFLAAGVDDDELGDLSLERMPKPLPKRGRFPSITARPWFSIWEALLEIGRAPHHRSTPTSSIITIRVKALAF